MKVVHPSKQMRLSRWFTKPMDSESGPKSGNSSQMSIARVWDERMERHVGQFGGVHSSFVRRKACANF